MKRLAALVLILSSSLLLSMSCSTPKSAPPLGPPSCAGNQACPNGTLCAWDDNCYSPGRAPPNPRADMAIPAMPDLTPPCTQTSCNLPTPICDLDSGLCVACVVDTNCPDGRICQARQCVAGCSFGHGCGDGGTCDVDAGQCKGCHNDADCGDPKSPRCDAGSGRCVPCLPANDNCQANTYCAVLAGTYQCSMGCKVDNDCNAMPALDGGAPMKLACCNHVCSDVDSDPANCGRCQSACPNRGGCCAGACSDPSMDVNNCGGCGIACVGKNASWQCVASKCAVAGCDNGYQDCNKSPLDGCEVNVTTDPKNCLGCGNACVVPGGVAGCNNGCTIAACNPGLADCDKSVVDGCEVNVMMDVNHCGGCGNACIPGPNASAACLMGRCGVGSCANGFGDCDKLPGNGCEAVLGSDVANCGMCGNPCPQVANGTPGCLVGVCGAASCSNGFQHCSNNPKDGCETNLNSDPKSCGQCGNVCAGLPHASPACANGVCGLGTCLGTFKDCNGNPNDGCEVDTSADVNNCGQCGMACGALKNGVPACVKGTCGVASCNQGFADCDNNPVNGCEVNLNLDPANCGQCGRACPNGQSCSGGACVSCGNDCWGPSGCLTNAGRCIQFTCRAGNAGASLCNGCKGWKDVTRSQWLNGGYCGDVTARYRISDGSATHCGQAASCCGSSGACGGGDNAWHFYEPNDGNNYFLGPTLGNYGGNSQTNCTFWNNVDNSGYTRITVCERP